MDALNLVVKVPSWAYDFCFYYLAVAAVVVVYSLYTLVQLFLLPSAVQKVVPMTALVVALLLSSMVSVLLTMMQFWVCRSALNPRNMKEMFAVACKKSDDCAAVAGPQKEGSPCTCGGRGFCGGCTMNSDVEPAWLPEYGEPLAGL